jgi:hypothetical protein
LISSNFSCSFRNSSLILTISLLSNMNAIKTRSYLRRSRKIRCFCSTSHIYCITHDPYI